MSNKSASFQGYTDGLYSRQQDGFIWCESSDEWLAYHAGYKKGAIDDAVMTGTVRHYFDPEHPHELQSAKRIVANGRSQNGGAFTVTAEQHTCHFCGTSFSNYGDYLRHNCDAPYVPFQDSAAYADVLPEEQRDDFVGA